MKTESKLTKKQQSLLDALPQNEEGEEVTVEMMEDYHFCPRCGSTKMRWTGNMSEHPEHYEKFFCIRCNFLLGMIDNSPYLSWCQYKYNNYEVEL